MRNPDRIEPFMQLVAKVWKEKCPDWRFGQFIMNVFDDIGNIAFYMEEPEMLQYIEDYFKKEDNNGYNKRMVYNEWNAYTDNGRAE